MSSSSSADRGRPIASKRLALFGIGGLSFAFPGIDAIARGGNALGSASIPAIDGAGIGVLLVAADGNQGYFAIVFSMEVGCGEQLEGRVLRCLRRIEVAKRKHDQVK